MQMMKSHRISTLASKFTTILAAIIVITVCTTYAEIIPNCKFLDTSKGHWGPIEMKNGYPAFYCSLPMSGPIIDGMIIADGYKANIFWGYRFGCGSEVNTNYGMQNCPTGNLIGTDGPDLSTICQSMYYASYQKSYENGCCYVREHATYGEWLPFFGLYQYAINLQKWVCNPLPEELPVRERNQGLPPCPLKGI